MKIYFSHSAHFDFNRELYEPIKASPLFTEHEFVLPYDDPEKSGSTKDMIKNCDVVMAEVSIPSTTQGIEIGWADTLGKPVVCVSKAGEQVSLSLQWVTNYFVEYEGPSDLIEKLNQGLRFLAEQ